MRPRVVKNLPSLESASSSCFVRLDSTLLWFLETTPLTRVLLRPLVRLTMACMFSPVPACCLHLNFSNPPTGSVPQSNLHIAVSARQITRTGCDWISAQSRGHRDQFVSENKFYVSLSLLVQNCNNLTSHHQSIQSFSELSWAEHLELRPNCWASTSQSEVQHTSSTNSPIGPPLSLSLSLPRKVIICSSCWNRTPPTTN